MDLESISGLLLCLIMVAGVLYVLWAERERKPRFRVYIDGHSNPYSAGLREDVADAIVRNFARKNVLARKVEE